MTKADLVQRAAAAVGPRVAKKDCGLVVDAFLDAVKDALERGEGIEIRGFGTFKVRRRKRRTARNPRTGGTGRGSGPRRAGLPALVTPARAGGAGERLRVGTDVRPVLGWDGSGTVFGSRNFPGIEAVLRLFRGGGIRHQIVGETADRAVPVRLT